MATLEERATEERGFAGGNPYLVFVNAGPDPRIQYLTAKKVLQFWGDNYLSGLLESFRNRENVALCHAETEDEAALVAAQFAGNGVEAWCIDQRRLGVRA